MKKFERFIAVLVVFALALTLFVAFRPSEAISSSKKVTISTSMWGDINAKYDFIAAFERKYPNIKVNVIKAPENYSEKLQAMIAANKAPDVPLVWECDIGRFAKNGVIIPLDPYIKKTKEFTMDDFIPAFAKLTKMQGAVYGLPWCFATEIMYYNKTLFDKAKVPYPTDKWSWEDVLNAAKKLTIVKGGKTIQWGIDYPRFVGIWYALIGAAGDDVADEKGNVALGKGVKTAVQWVYDLVNKYKVMPAPSTSMGVTDLFASGKAAMTFTGSWMISTYRDIKDFKWDIAPLPKKVRQYSNLHTGFYTISKTSKHKEESWKFIEFMLSEEGQKILSQGYNNPSARKSIMAKGYYKVAGPNGPTNWKAMDETAQFAQLGYVLLPPGGTDKFVKRLESAVAKQVSIDQAVNEGIKELKEITASYK
ncbi:extracellular solute-binding protein family 1 [Caldicellulosiruptor owensensis OL]|uniref:Extracellular solute-binding protein family 1 n=1 Tax=Caldicellulosiruptor owensensis (strain ATCC 700167 / DSM 13100 / OL) TaxID=632518 RepID=E4Q5R2_CALOW|nr:sugar ABC transporter substrate-binding protein [Caldicellulosiruptor owensensis]ADQ05471.1 extracellular solute-binding protein family 1 [Caldicellulosiruptor owensensis OL]